MDDTVEGAQTDESAVDDQQHGHPTLTALSGFYAGLALVIVVPGAYAAVLASTVSFERAETLFPFVLLTFLVPLVLMAVPKTRRFGSYLLMGMVSTLLVVAVVGGFVLWLLFRTGT